MPDVLSIALGGGTHVKVDHDTVRTHTHSHAYVHTQGSPQFIQSSKVIVISSTPDTFMYTLVEFRVWLEQPSTDRNLWF